MPYPFDSININNREVLLKEILEDTASSKSAFEQNCFDFIKRWFSTQQEFTINTSGSTGPPKNILITRSQMIASATATAMALQLKQNDTALICLDPKFIAGQMMFVRSFNTGMWIVATEPASNPLQSIPEKSKIDFAAIVPLQLSTILVSADSKRLNDIRDIIVGGAAVSSDIIPQLERYKCSFVATYGMTETISHIALQRLNGTFKSEYFTVLPGVVIDTDHRGCLCITAPYLEQPLITNDLVKIISATQFEWLGRVDNVINTGGVKVSPEHIERELERLKPMISLHDRLVISSRENPILGEEVVCIIEREALDNEFKQKLFTKFREVLTRFEAPKHILCIFPLPETKTGKIDRTALKITINKQH